MDGQRGDAESDLLATLRRGALGLGISIALHGVLAFSLAGTHPVAALSFAAHVPVLAAFAWQLPRMRSRVLATLLMLVGLGMAVAVVRSDQAYGHRLSPGSATVAFVAAMLELAVGAFCWRASHLWRARHGGPIDGVAVARAVLLFAAMFAAGELWASMGGGRALDQAVQSAVATVVTYVAYVLVVLPWILRRARAAARVDVAPEAEVPRPDEEEDPWAGLELPDGDDDASAARSAAPRPAAPRPAASAASAAAPRPAPHPAPAPPAPPPAPAPSAPRRYEATGARPASSRADLATFALATVASAAAAGAWIVLDAAAPAPLAAVEPPPPSPAAATSLPAATPATAAPSPTVATTLDDAEIFGGQTLAWWTAALDATQGQPSAALLTERARRNGLEADASGVLRPSPRLVSGREALTLGEPLLREATGPGNPPSLDALAEALREPARDDRLITRAGAPRVVLAPRAGTRAALRVVFSLDPEHEGEEAALDGLALHALLHASAHPGSADLHAAIEGVDGTLDVEHGTTFAAITLEAPSADFPELAQRLLRATLSPQVAGRGLPAARRRALVEIPADGSSAARLLAALVLGRYGFQSSGTAAQEILARFSAADVTARIASAYPPARAQVVVSGAFDAPAMATLLARFHGGAASAPRKLARNLAGTYQAPARIPFHLLAYPLDLPGPRELGRALLFAAVLEERLFHQLRDQGQVYTVNVSIERDAWQTFLVVQIPFGPEASPVLARNVTQALTTIARADIDAPTLERNQRYLLELLRQRDGDPSRWVRSPLAAEGPQFATQAVDSIRSATGPALLEELALWIEPSRAIHVELGPTFAVRYRGDGGRR